VDLRPGEVGLVGEQVRAVERSPEVGVGRLPVAQVAALVRGLLNLRFALLLVTIVLLGRGTVETSWVSAVVVAAALASFIPLWYWHVLAPSLLRDPRWLALDVLTAVCIVAATGAEGPFLHFTLTTAALSGLLHGRLGAAVTSVTLVGGYFLVLLLGAEQSTPSTFQVLVGAPALYPMAAAAAAGVRALLDRQAMTEVALARAHERVAAGRERARLAREMHDSLSKTLHGIALSAAAVEGWAGKDPVRTAEAARLVAQAARTAAEEARALIGDLRDDRLDRSLDEAVRDYAEAWSRTVGIRVRMDADRIDDLGPSARYELFSILKEALRNVEQHARAAEVSIGVHRSATGVRLSVADDGVGFEQPGDVRELARAGHYGLVGMSERAQRARGWLQVSAAPGEGVAVTVEVPFDASAAAGDPRATPSEPFPSGAGA
jgi:signal transduction histidine kinase